MLFLLYCFTEIDRQFLSEGFKLYTDLSQREGWKAREILYSKCPSLLLQWCWDWMLRSFN